MNTTAAAIIATEGEKMAGCENDTLINLARIVGLTKFNCATALAYDISSLFILLFAVFLLFYLVYENTRADQSNNNNNTCSQLKFSDIALIFIVVAGSAFGGFITVAVVAFLFLVYGILYMMMMVKSNDNDNNNASNASSSSSSGK